MSEEWRPVTGFEGLYEVSSRGRVKSLDRLNVRGVRMRERLLKPVIASRTGYPRVSLRRDGRDTVRAVHVLVAEAFIGPRPPGHEVRHINGVRTDPGAHNLIYGTRSENMRDAVRHGTHPQASKTHCKHGHEFTPENTYQSRGRRNCRKCHLDRTHKFRGKASAK